MSLHLVALEFDALIPERLAEFWAPILCRPIDASRIGGIAGDGMPETGYFWSKLLGWPLVWDQDQETAIQSPDGGVKITWGGPPIPAKSARNRLRWVVAAGEDRREDRARLRALGAALVSERPDGTELADPEGNEFVLL